jgi:hypothetical protein
MNNSLPPPRRRTGFIFPLLVLIAIFLIISDQRASSCAEADKKDLSSSQTDPRFSREVPKTILDLQPFRQAGSIKIDGPRGEEGVATLTNLNPHSNLWYLLQLRWGAASREETYHLENASPRTQRLLLDRGNPHGLVIARDEEKYGCDLWGAGIPERLKEARRSGAAYAPLCGGRLYLRNPTKGHRTEIEMVTDFLRDNVPAGEKIVSFVRDTFFDYIYQKKAQERVESKDVESQPRIQAEDGPMSALRDPNQADRMVKPVHLGIEIEGTGPDGMVLGNWYAAKDNPGIYVSVIVPNRIAPEILRSYRNVVAGLDNVEAGELIYLVAFDLDRFHLKYALGTTHPRVGWTDHMLSQMKDTSLPGPDGIGSIAPLVSTGLINPRDEGRTAAAFTGGFKREHGAFRYGELALKNHGSHYGFIENGVVFSKLQPGLSTLYVLNEGGVEMKTWTDGDNALLPKIEYARQNGVPIIAGFDPAAQMSVPGPLVSRWGEGNWSGSVDGRLRTMRAGAALQGFRGKRFFIYAFFWSATPPAMARVFQAYGCRYGMLLDMNALVHTYLAIYKRQGSNLYIQHLIQGMSQVDMSVKGRYIPRFLGYSDDRDFFYLTRKDPP